MTFVSFTEPEYMTFCTTDSGIELMEIRYPLSSTRLWVQSLGWLVQKIIISVKRKKQVTPQERINSYAISLKMASGMRTIYPNKLNKESEIPKRFSTVDIWRLVSTKVSIATKMKTQVQANQCITMIISYLKKKIRQCIFSSC